MIQSASTDSLSLPTHTPLTKGQITGFGFADFGFNLYYQGLSLFLLYYYTDILEIRASTAGFIFMGAMFWDAITDPAMGLIASRTRSRFGRFRPYLAFAGVPLAISFVLMFAAPLIWPGAIVLACVLSHLLFRTCYTIVSIPYSALSATMTEDSGERGSLAGVRMIFATIGGLFTAFMTLQIARWMGGDNLITGFVWVGIIYGVLATLIFWVTFFTTSEDSEVSDNPSPSLKDTLLFLRKNRVLWLLVAAISIGVAGGTIFGKGLVYYVLYVTGLEIDIGLVLTVLTGSIALAVPVWILISRTLSKRQVWLTGATIIVAAMLAMFLMPPDTLPHLMGLIFIIGLGQAAFGVTFWSMLPDTVEYGQWRSGIRDEGIVFGLNQLAQKIGNGIGLGLVGVLLEVVGYQANQVQTDDTIVGLRIITILVPLVLIFASTCLIWFYQIDRKLHSRLRRAIHWRERNSLPAREVDASSISDPTKL